MTIVIQHKESGRRAKITTLFTSHIPTEANLSQPYFTAKNNFAYVRDFNQVLKCVEAKRMVRVKSCKSLPTTMFGKRKGPFLKLAPAEGWEIVDYFEEI